MINVSGRQPHEWPGEEWQAWCELLFHARHAPAGYVPVPDKDRGDCGIEGFSIDGTGCLYQCYAPEAHDLRKRYEDQRDKVTTDLRKLVTNRIPISKLLGDHQMQRWVLVVPIHDSKDLVAHTRKKELEVRAEDLPFLTPDFSVVVQTDRLHFATERASVVGSNAAAMPPVAELDATTREVEVDKFKIDEAEQVAAMDAKLGRGRFSDPTSARDRFLRQLVDADNISEQLRRDFPALHERIVLEHRREERDILGERDLDLLHKGSLRDVWTRLEARLLEATPSIGSDHANRLAHGAIGRWLLECPLDFPEPK